MKKGLSALEGPLLLSNIPTRTCSGWSCRHCSVPSAATSGSGWMESARKWSPSLSPLWQPTASAPWTCSSGSRERGVGDHTGTLHSHSYQLCVLCVCMCVCVCVCVCMCVCVCACRQRIIDEFLSKASQIQQKWHAENQKMREQEERFYVSEGD